MELVAGSTTPNARSPEEISYSDGFRAEPADALQTLTGSRVACRHLMACEAMISGPILIAQQRNTDE